jgi:hypothetical protein
MNCPSRLNTVRKHEYKYASWFFFLERVCICAKIVQVALMHLFEGGNIVMGAAYMHQIYILLSYSFLSPISLYSLIPFSQPYVLKAL